MKPHPDPPCGPVPVGELLMQYPYGQRITGWDPRNPPEVERAFRVGYTIGASRCAVCELEGAAEFEERLHNRRGDIYWGELRIGFERWSDRRAAVLRGATQGAMEMIRAKAEGVQQGLPAWLGDLHAWAAEEPIRLDWSSAKPPDPSQSDSPPLGRNRIPKRLWSEVFGLWAATPPLPTTTTPLMSHRPVLVRLSDVQPELVRWLWPGRIAMGKLTLLCGDPGLGKSFITLDLAARTSCGSPWPDLPLLPNTKGGVILLSAEDDLADTIRPRLDAAGADAAQIVAIQAVRRIQGDGATQVEYFDLTQDLPALEAAIQQTTGCRMVIIDPLTAYLGKTDSHNNAEVRAILARLFDLAARHGVAVLAVTHLNKANSLPAIYREMGSLAFVAAARAVWAVVRDENDETGRRRFFVPIKNNLGTDETGLAYALESVGQAAHVAWESEPVNVRADDALNGGGRKAAIREDASQFVIDTLNANGGDMLSEELSEAAEAHGISKITLRRAKKTVAQCYKEKGRDGRWRIKVKDDQPDGQIPIEQVRTT